MSDSPFLLVDFSWKDRCHSKLRGEQFASECGRQPAFYPNKLPHPLAVHEL